MVHLNDGSGARSSAIRVVGASKIFGEVHAVDRVDLEIHEGEFFSLLGPSGCGKTTTLRMMAGFEYPSEGRVYLGGIDVTDTPPNRRDVHMVFQQYALFPHMSVFANVAFGLRLKKVPRRVQREKVDRILDVVRLTGLESRRPLQLSGGQQQRVALARALVNEPEALLLDEPLGALDVKLRRQMQGELKRIQRELKTTFVYVTHDQEEALSMSNRVAVMNNGRVEQIGTPLEIYDHPATEFVADFVGTANVVGFVPDEMVEQSGVMHLEAGDRLVVHLDEAVAKGQRVTLVIRPERLRLVDASVVPPEATRVRGTVTDTVFLGSVQQTYVDTALGRLVVLEMSGGQHAEQVVPPGTAVVVTWSAEDTVEIGRAEPISAPPEREEG